MKNNKVNFCCELLNYYLSEKEIPIIYNQQDRSFSIRVLDGGSSVITMRYCPWCGKEFPENLRNIFFDELSKYLNKDAGIEDIDGAHKDFQTDAWWKKRKL